MKALTITTITGKLTGGGEGRTLIASAAGDLEDVTPDGGIGISTRAVSRINSTTPASVVSVSSCSTSHTSSRQIFGGLDVCERLLIVGVICTLLCLWAVIRCCILFVLFVRMLLKHGLHDRHTSS